MLGAVGSRARPGRATDSRPEIDCAPRVVEQAGVVGSEPDRREHVWVSTIGGRSQRHRRLVVDAPAGADGDSGPDPPAIVRAPAPCRGRRRRRAPSRARGCCATRVPRRSSPLPPLLGLAPEEQERAPPRRQPQPIAFGVEPVRSRGLGKSMRVGDVDVGENARVEGGRTRPVRRMRSAPRCARVAQLLDSTCGSSASPRRRRHVGSIPCRSRVSSRATGRGTVRAPRDAILAEDGPILGHHHLEVLVAEGNAPRDAATMLPVTKMCCTPAAWRARARSLRAPRPKLSSHRSVPS